MTNLTNKQQVVDYLYEMIEQLEKEGYIPTIELVIDDLVTKMTEEEESEPKEDDDGEDYSGASEGDR